MPEKSYGTIITTAGAAIIAECILNGGKLNIKEAAAGDGGGAYYEPTIDQGGLVNEKWRGDIAGAEVSTSTPNMIDVKIVIDDDVGGFTIREMGLFDEDGTLIAICNTPDTEKVALEGGISGKLTMVMHIIVADASVVTFTITPSLDTVSRAEMEAAIAEHNTTDTSHSDLRAALRSKMDTGTAYTKAESDTLMADAVSTHNTAEDAHPTTQVAMSGLESRLTTLELKYGSDVTGNSFEVTFVNLTGLEVAGVWNEELARIEF